MAVGRKPRLVADGVDGIEGRSLLLISALHHAASALAGCEVRFLGVHDLTVRVAIEALRWDTGLDAADTPEGEEADALSGADLYAAVCFRDTAHLPLVTVAAQGIPMMVAVQFPDPARHGSAVFALQRAAHDPRLLADILLAKVRVA